MLSQSVVIVLLIGATGVAVWARFSWRSLFLLAGVLEVLGVFLLGLPGAAFLETVQPIMQRMGQGSIAGDGAWPAAILMSVVWPLALAPAYLAARSVRAGLRQGLVAFAVLVTGCALMSGLVYAMAF